MTELVLWRKGMHRLNKASNLYLIATKMLLKGSPSPLPSVDDPSAILTWMLEEFDSLPKIIYGAGDYVASFSVESILKLLEARDCIDLVKFRQDGPHFPEASSVSALRVSEDVSSIKRTFVKEFWMASSQQFAR